MKLGTPAAIVTVVLLLIAAVQPMTAQQQAAGVARITLDEARTAVDSAEAEARRNGWNLAFVISDADGTPIYLRRMDGVPKRNYDVAMNKISTSITSGMHTGDYAAAVRAGTIKPIEGALLFEGGLLLRRNGQVVGAFSASGASGADDAKAVRAGMVAIGIQPGATSTATAAAAPAAAPAPPTVRVPVEVLSRYVGEYEMGEQVLTVRLKGDTLTVQPPGQPEMVLDPISQNRFKLRGNTQLEVDFIPDAAGVMHHSVYFPDGEEMLRIRRKPAGGGDD